MRDKSKIIAFLVSVIPGASHLYIGMKDRALIFFIFFVIGVTGGVGLAILTSEEMFLVLTIIGYLILWLIALIDMYSAWRNIEISQLYNSSDVFQDVSHNKLNKKSVSLALSIIPGAGHMYLGYQKKGLIIMASFFFSIFFMGWLGISMLLFLLPLIWFYSFFDAMHIADGFQEIENQKLVLPNIKPEWVGIALIAIGVVILVEKILFPFIGYHIRRYVQTSLVSLTFIAVGINMLVKSKKSLSQNDEIEEEQNDED
jgi:hypothetical protein